MIVQKHCNVGWMSTIYVLKTPFSILTPVLVPETNLDDQISTAQKCFQAVSKMDCRWHCFEHLTWIYPCDILTNIDREFNHIWPFHYEHHYEKFEGHILFSNKQSLIADITNCSFSLVLTSSSRQMLRIKHTISVMHLHPTPRNALSVTKFQPHHTHMHHIMDTCIMYTCIMDTSTMDTCIMGTYNMDTCIMDTLDNLGNAQKKGCFFLGSPH